MFVRVLILCLIKASFVHIAMSSENGKRDLDSVEAVMEMYESDCERYYPNCTYACVNCYRETLTKGYNGVKVNCAGRKISYKVGTDNVCDIRIL